MGRPVHIDINILIWLFIIYLCTVKLCLTKVTKSIMLDRAEVCETPPNSTIQVREISVQTINHCTYLYSVVDIARDIQRVKGSIRVTRCANKEDPDSCEYFTTLKLADACPLLKAKGTLTSSLVYSFLPYLICPLKKGRYVLTNGTYDPNLAQFFPMDNWYWKVILNGFAADNNEHLLRLCVEGRIVPYYS